MPLLKIQTNVDVPPSETAALLGAMTDLVARELNKPKEYVQAILEPRVAMQLAGSGQPTAFAELRALDLSEAMAKPFSAALARFLEEKLSIPPNRLFINFFDIPRPLWGWNGSTFA